MWAENDMYCSRPTRFRLATAVGSLLAALAAPLAAGGVASADEWGPPSLVTSSQTSTEEELVLKYNPILKLTQQSSPCSKSGNVYNPAPVEIILGNPAVQLRRLDDDRTVITTAPTAEDVGGLDGDHDLNWPGNPRRPGCVYESDYLRLTAELATRPTTYAHVATEDGVRGIAVQYWYNYYYNDFANKHEGDWEMVQVMFDDADTVEEALQQDPTRTAYSGHAGGEIANWTDKKLEKVGTQPVVYVTTGAHAAHYSEGTFIGVAKAGQVFGCDPTTGPHRSVEPEVVLLPDEAPTSGEFAWLSYAGLWGEENGSLFSGIDGPAVRARWHEPFTWAGDLRDFSDKIPDNFLGIDPVGAICAIVNTGSDIMLFYGEHPQVVIGAALIMMGSLGAVLVYGAPAWLTGRPGPQTEDQVVSQEPKRGFLRRERRLAQIMRGALRIYVAQWPLWLIIASVFIPVSFIVMLLDQLVGLEWLTDLANTTVLEPATELIGMAIGALIAGTVVSLAVLSALRDLDEGNRPSLSGVFRTGARPWTVVSRPDLAVHGSDHAAVAYDSWPSARHFSRGFLGSRRTGRGYRRQTRHPRPAAQYPAGKGKLAARARHYPRHRAVRRSPRTGHRVWFPGPDGPTYRPGGLPRPLCPLRTRPFSSRLHRQRPPLW